MNLLNNAASESNPKSKPTPLSEKEAQSNSRDLYHSHYAEVPCFSGPLIV
jgi:hypothetical protein